VSPGVELKQIRSKLHSFKQLSSADEAVILSFNGEFSWPQLVKLVEEIKSLCLELGVILQAIQANESIDIAVTNFSSRTSNNGSTTDELFSQQELNTNAVIHVNTIYAIESIAVVSLPLRLKSEQIQNKALLCEEPIRSGIRIENDGDVIITSFVSDNAEVVASGNIHVYGEAKGRLIAGSNGDKKARIFARQFNAEIVSIGGVYKVIESKLPASIYKKAVMISLDEKDRLNVLPLSDS
jgi:septum site-determining protein MinC